MEPEQFVEHVLRLAKPSEQVNAGSADDRLLYLLSETCTQQLRRRQSEMLATSRGKPVLLCYMSDGWGSNIVTRITSKVGELVLRNARFRHEFLLQIALMKVFGADGSVETAVLVDGAVSLRHGKRAWQCFAAGCEFMALGRQQGHDGIIATVYLFDGLLCKPLGRHFRARHRMYYSEYGPMGGAEHLLSSLTDWVFTMKCTAHSCSNAVKTGLREVANDQLLENVHIAIEALRNGAEALHEHAMKFLMQHLCFSEQRSGSQSDIQVFWCSLGVTGSILDEFTEIDPVWRDDKLFVAAHLEHDVQACERVLALMTYAFRWSKFSETRWAGVGRSGRRYMLSLLMGLEGVIKICKADEHCGFSHLGGYPKRANEYTKEYLLLAAYATYPSEAVVLELMEDDRLLRRSKEIKGIMLEEFQYLVSLPPYVWRRLSHAMVGKREPSSLRTDVLRSASTSMGYINREVFAQLSQLPFVLTQGDIEQRLNDLKSAEGISEPIATKIQALLALEYPRAQLVSALQLVREAPTTTTLVEQQHGSGAVVMRAHPEYGEKTLRVRQCLHQCQRLIRPAPVDVKLQRLRADVEALETASHHKITGRHAFFATKNKTKVALLPKGDKFQQSQGVMKQHAKEFAELSAAQQAMYNQAAIDMRKAKARETQARCEELRGSIALLEQRRAQELLSIGVVNHLDSCRFSSDDIDKMCTYYDWLASQPGVVSRLITSAVESPRAPTSEEQQVVLQFQDDLHAEPNACPWWVRLVALQRHRFVGCGFSSAADAPVVYLLLYAIQSPYGAHFLKLHRQAPRAPSLQEVVTSGDRDLHLDRAHYGYAGFECLDELQIEIGEEGDIVVHPGLTFGENSVFTDCEPLLFEDFTRFHPQVNRQPRAGPRAAPKLHLPADVREQLLQEYPWLTEEDLPGHVARRFAGGHGGARPRHGGHDTGDKPDEGRVADDKAGGEDAVHVEDVVEELAAFRADHNPSLAEDLFFFTRIIGGQWTAAHRGVVADAVAGFARGGAPKEWCNKFKWPKQHANCYSLYGIEGANHLASEYVRRSHYYFQLWLESDDQHFSYEQHHIDGYEENLEFMEWLCEQPADSDAFARGSDLVKITPVNP